MKPHIIAAVINTTKLPSASADNGTINKVLNIVFSFSASIAVLIIVVAGLRYILAHGDPNATAQAKMAIIYSLVGLIVIMAAYSIVTFVVKGIV